MRDADLPVDVNAMAARARPLEQVRAGFHVLVRQVEGRAGATRPAAARRHDPRRLQRVRDLHRPLPLLPDAGRPARRRGRPRGGPRRLAYVDPGGGRPRLDRARRRARALPRHVTADPRRRRRDQGRGDRHRPGRAQPAPAGAQPRRARPAGRRVQPNDRAAPARRAARCRRSRGARAHDRRSHRRPARRQRHPEHDRLEPPALLRRRQPRAAHAAHRHPRRMRDRACRRRSPTNSRGRQS